MLLRATENAVAGHISQAAICPPLSQPFKWLFVLLLAWLTLVMC